jgi:hypothetical protein
LFSVVKMRLSSELERPKALTLEDMIPAWS